MSTGMCSIFTGCVGAPFVIVLDVTKFIIWPALVLPSLNAKNNPAPNKPSATFPRLKRSTWSVPMPTCLTLTALLWIFFAGSSVVV